MKKESLLLPLPPALHGTAEEKTEQLYRYLYRLAELLNAQQGKD